MRLRRLRNVLASTSAAAANPVPPPPLSAEDHHERQEAQRRMPRKWRAFDRLVAEYAAADSVYRGGPGPRQQQQPS